MKSVSKRKIMNKNKTVIISSGLSDKTSSLAESDFDDKGG